ncbi:MAG: Ku protein [Desulfobacterales bacterium]
MPDKNASLIRRALWSGSLTFGLVSVPVAIFPGISRRRTSLRMLTPDGVPLQRRYYCPKENKPIEADEIVRGYEIEKERFVVVTEEELESLAPRKSREIDLRLFVPVDQIDPMYFDRAYFLVPTGDSPKAYRLLAETMESTARAGIATFVMRGKEYLVAILAENGIIRAETLRFADEIRTPETIGLSKTEDFDRSDADGMKKEIDASAGSTFHTGELKDEYEEKLARLVQRKKSSGKIVHYSPEKADERGEADVIDLVQVIKRSIEQAVPETGPGEADQSRLGDLQAKSKKALYDQAKSMDIPGRSGMSREELIEALQSANSDTA